MNARYWAFEGLRLAVAGIAVVALLATSNFWIVVVVLAAVVVVVTLSTTAADWFIPEQTRQPTPTDRKLASTAANAALLVAGVFAVAQGLTEDDALEVALGSALLLMPAWSGVSLIWRRPRRGS
jgi:hypothetical protein